MMPFATLHTTNHPRRAHPAVTRAALCYHDRDDTESGRVAAQQRGTHRPTPCGYNRLIEVHDASNAIIATYRYDPFGRRLSKTLNTTGQGSSTYYFYSAEGLIAEADSNGQIIQSYGYAPGSTFTTNPLWTKLTTAGTATYYTYQNDHLGTPQKLLNQSGLTVWSATYDAFGRATVDPASTITNNLRFPGQYQDQETGLHYNWMRYYDPTTGRYVTSDPIGLRGGINEYVYVESNPVLYHDPEGLASNMRPPMRSPGSGNSSQRRYGRRHLPLRPDMPAGGDSANDAAGYFDDEGEFVCLRWNCPINPNQCSKGDTRRSSDFLPAASDPANSPKGCTCDERRFRLKDEPKIDPKDWIDQMRDARAKAGKPIKWFWR